MLANEVIDLKLAARANFWPVESIYYWEGVKETANHFMVMFTTHNDEAHDLESHIIAKHSITVPMIARTQVDMVNEAYQLWVNETLGM